jgi:hypothetical protein
MKNFGQDSCFSGGKFRSWPGQRAGDDDGHAATDPRRTAEASAERARATGIDASPTNRDIEGARARGVGGATRLGSRPATAERRRLPKRAVSRRSLCRIEAVAPTPRDWTATPLGSLASWKNLRNIRRFFPTGREVTLVRAAGRLLVVLVSQPESLCDTLIAAETSTDGGRLSHSSTFLRLRGRCRRGLRRSSSHRIRTAAYLGSDRGVTDRSRHPGPAHARERRPQPPAPAQTRHSGLAT